MFLAARNMAPSQEEANFYTCVFKVAKGILNGEPK